VYELQIYVRLRRHTLRETGGKQRKPTVNKAGKSETQIEAQRIENYIDEQNQIDSVYIQTMHPETEEVIAVYLDKKRLAHILAEDVLTSYAPLIAAWQTELVDYFARNAVVHTKENHIEIFNHNDYADHVQSTARSQYSHKIVERMNTAILHTCSDK
jgi:hypothetical protein